MRRLLDREDVRGSIARLARQCPQPEIAPWVGWRPGDSAKLPLGAEWRYTACAPHSYPDTDDVHPWPIVRHACARDWAWARRARVLDACQS